MADMGIAIRVASPKLVMEEVSEILISMHHKAVHNVCQYTEPAVVTIANRNILEEMKGGEISWGLSLLGAQI